MKIYKVLSARFKPTSGKLLFAFMKINLTTKQLFPIMFSKLEITKFPDAVSFLYKQETPLSDPTFQLV